MARVTLETPYGKATDLADAVVRYVMHGEKPPLTLVQALRDDYEDVREALESAVAAFAVIGTRSVRFGKTHTAVEIVKSITDFAREHAEKSRKALHGNPPGRRRKRARGRAPRAAANPKGVVIYPRAVELRGQKADGKFYRHPFEGKNPIMGLPDGSLLIPARGKPLWGAV